MPGGAPYDGLYGEAPSKTKGLPFSLLLDVVAQSLKPVKLFSQQLPTFLLFRDRRSVAQECWIHLHSSSNIVGATHAHYAWFTKTYWLYPSHDALQVPTLMGLHATTPNIAGATMLGVVASWLAG